MASITTIYGFKMIALAYRAKSDNDKKAKSKKANFIIYFLATDCVTTLPGIPAEKKENYLDGTRASSNFIYCCKFIE